jgi:hypothetical protein
LKALALKTFKQRRAGKSRKWLTRLERRLSNRHSSFRNTGRRHLQNEMNRSKKALLSPRMRRGVLTVNKREEIDRLLLEAEERLARLDLARTATMEQIRTLQRQRESLSLEDSPGLLRSQHL